MYLDFRMIKEKLEVVSVINYFKLEGLTIKNGSYQGSCPIHKGDNHTAFRFSIEKKIYNCFTRCGGGNILDFICNYCKVPIYEAGNIGLNIIDGLPLKQYGLKYQLKLNPYHNYLSDRGISLKTRQYFGIGFSSRGYLKNRIAIPIHSASGILVAYAGRSIDESKSKYLFPAGFNKSDHIYNFHRVSENDDCVYIVEGFFDVFRLHDLNVKAISIMGTTLSKKQLDLLKTLNTHYILMLDGDIAGRTAMARILRYMQYNNLNVSEVALKDNTDPADLDLETLPIKK